MTETPRSDDSPQPELVPTAMELRRVRKAAKITQIEMAERIGTNQSTISRIETARQPITHPQIMTWYSACGYTLQAAAIGTEGKSLQLATALERVNPVGLETLTKLARAWPDLPEAAQSMIMSLVAGIDADHIETLTHESNDEQ